MKKIIGIILILIGLIAGCLGLVFIFGGTNTAVTNPSMSIIGGADGPTAIFVTGKAAPQSMIMLMAAGLLLVIAGVIFIIYSIKKRT